MADEPLSRMKVVLVVDGGTVTTAPAVSLLRVAVTVSLGSKAPVPEVEEI